MSVRRMTVNAMPNDTTVAMIAPATTASVLLATTAQSLRQSEVPAASR